MRYDVPGADRRRRVLHVTGPGQSAAEIARLAAIGLRTRYGVSHLCGVGELGADVAVGLRGMLGELYDLVPLRAQAARKGDGR